VALDAIDLPELAAEIDAMEAEFGDAFSTGYIAEPAAKLRARLSQYYSALLGVGDFAPVRCNAPWVSSVIESDGTVRPCFFQPALGNVRTDGPLESILNSERAVAWRKGLDTRRDAICRKCVCSLSLGVEGGA
jgi:MoaA/NifB/PqqE/SkfB family radical SAM enzyme